MSAYKFDKAKSIRIVKIVAEVGDSGTQVQHMRGKLAAEFKGAPARKLDDVAAAMLRDQFKAEFTARTTVAESSVPVMTSECTRVTTWMPVILALSGERFAIAGKSWRNLVRTARALHKCEGDVPKAFAMLEGKGRKDYKKSAAAHLKSLLTLQDGKFLTAAEKSAIRKIAAAHKLVIESEEE